ncbi:type II toxin-antitoxin system RelE/ParE family toxin [Chlorobium phaeobacteroides]|jgi:plasmid stabilization system protein ParE|uniref:Plasmid stabilization system n=1 Tax=Chlorobium phaeobacteroides (strain DSM 266 / SMG 266 / 2430) TaxID=290317 RepID=A1BFT3_CHLPD|nr:type II toxin-antitoxin system RelE/ParE family toxin [Chlorobium phaeobacteroides]ABL65260.1 plasmid stabilization system [Chlorobium phaeobacteroides DSM 266]MBV5327921.1 type II toxin-antitoxin system RelE/ParE family toxin [Chlorobium sp.]
MKFTVRFTPEAREDLVRLYSFMLEQDLKAAEAALEAIERGMAFLREFPFSYRKAAPQTPFLRELLIPFGNSGYVGLFEIENSQTVTILAVRHQREDDYL